MLWGGEGGCMCILFIPPGYAHVPGHTVEVAGGPGVDEGDACLGWSCLSKCRPSSRRQTPVCLAPHPWISGRTGWCSSAQKACGGIPTAQKDWSPQSCGCRLPGWEFGSYPSVDPIYWRQCSHSVLMISPECLAADMCQIAKLRWP
jgi:hypothetical protein